MKKTPAAEAMELLGSRFFFCRFIKKNGEERTGTFLLGVGRKKDQPTQDANHLIVWDLGIREYRKIPLARICEIHANGKIIRRDPCSGHFTWESKNG